MTEFMSTDVEFIKWDNFKVGEFIDLIYQHSDAQSDYGNYATFVDADTQCKLFGVAARAVMYKITQGIINPGDTVRLVYNGKKDSPKKGFKPFHDIEVKKAKVSISKPVTNAPVAPVAEVSKEVKDSWLNFEFEEV